MASRRVSELDNIFRRSTTGRKRTKLPTTLHPARDNIIREGTRENRDQSPAKRLQTEFEANIEETMMDGLPQGLDDCGNDVVSQSLLSDCDGSNVIGY